MNTQSELYYIPVDIDNGCTVLLGDIVRVTKCASQEITIFVNGEREEYTANTQVVMRDGTSHYSTSSVNQITHKMWNAISTYKRMEK